jgi:dTDP-4-amino-4,6-dideoxygalactose transaminase
MRLPLIDIVQQYKSIKPDIDQAISRVLSKGQFILGEELQLLEEELAKTCNARYGIGVNSGTDALMLSLMAYNIGYGDEVITTPFTFIATAEVIALLGARPVFVDINPYTFNIDVTKIEQAITKNTKAIIPVHLYGQPADMDVIMNIAKEYNLIVIEDAAQAILAQYRGKYTGSIGHIGCFSFFPTKNLGAYGDAGMIITNDEDIAKKLRILRDHGAKEKYYHVILGCNSRLDELQAAILRVKLKKLPMWTEERRRIASIYNQAFKNINWLDIPVEKDHCRCVYNQYTLRVYKNRDRLKAYLTQKGIPYAVHYPTPLHLQKVFSYLGYHEGNFPESERAANEVISLPIYPELTKSQIDMIISAVLELKG